MDKVTEQAVAAIGAASNDDWKLEPGKHAQSLPPEASLLREVLENPELQQIIKVFKTHDAEASRAQQSFRRRAKGAALASFFALVTGSLLVLPGYHFMVPEAIRTVSAVQTTLVALSILLLAANEIFNPFQRWMGQRSLAEQTRIALFGKVMESREPRPRQESELPLLPLQLEYFRRYLLDSQRKYYGQAGKRAKRAARGAFYWRLASLGLLFIAGLPLLWEVAGRPFTPGLINRAAGLMPEKTLLAQHAFLGIALAGTALKALVDSTTAISLNYRGAWRYPITAGSLDDLANRALAEARVDAANGERQPVEGFADSVQEVLMMEHREWLAIAKLT